MRPKSEGAPQATPLQEPFPCQQERRQSSPAVVRIVGRRMRQSLADEARILADQGLDLGRHVLVGLKEILGVLAALADAIAVERVPGARFLDDAGLGTQIDQLARLGDADAVHDVELDLLERGCNLVLDHFDAGLVADRIFVVLDRADAADVEPDGGIALSMLLLIPTAHLAAMQI